MRTERVLSDFLGHWRITREIVSRDKTRASFLRDGADASFSGHAEWRAVPGGATYIESGVLRLQGAAPMTAERRYVWAEDLSVRFEDGRAFHTVPALGGEATHFCDPDTYVVRYDFSDWPAFVVTYDVRGPRKDYAMTSRYVRAVAP